MFASKAQAGWFVCVRVYAQRQTVVWFYNWVTMCVVCALLPSSSQPGPVTLFLCLSMPACVLACVCMCVHSVIPSLSVSDRVCSHVQRRSHSCAWV